MLNDRWLFNVFFNGAGGDGGDGGDGGTGGTAGGGGGTSDAAGGTSDAGGTSGTAGSGAGGGVGFGAGGVASGVGTGVGTAGSAGEAAGFGASTTTGGTSDTGTASGEAAPGVAGSVSFGGGQAASGASPGVGSAGGVSTAATTGGGGGGGTAGGATGPGASTGGAATGGGGGTAAGGSSTGNSGLNAVLNALLSAQKYGFGLSGGDAGVPSIGMPSALQSLLGDVTTTAPGVTVSPLAPSPRGLSSSVVSQLNSELAALAGNQASQTFGTSLGGNPPGGQANMGFPSAGLAVSPRGGMVSSLNAPVGSTVGQSTISGNPANMPAVHAQNVAPAPTTTNAPVSTPAAPLGSDAATGGLASAAQTAVRQSNPAALAQSPTTTNQTTPGGAAGGQLMQLILGYLQGNPALAQLAASALG